MSGLLDKRMLFVTGKGGVGKSTVAAALGLAAARAGKHAIVAEVSGQDRVARALTGKPGADGRERELVDGLWGVSIDPDHALREYLEHQLPVKALSDLLASSRMFQYFAAATPGMRELLATGKAWDLGQEHRRTSGRGTYELVIVDAPATGHGLAMLASPRTFSAIARVGPVARQAATIDAYLRDPAATAVVAVATPEEMAVNEVLLLRERARAELGVAVGATIVNAVAPERFAASDGDALRAARADAGPREAAALDAALAELVQGAEQRDQIERLNSGAAAACELPLLTTSDIGPDELGRLARALERELLA